MCLSEGDKRLHNRPGNDLIMIIIIKEEEYIVLL